MATIAELIAESGNYDKNGEDFDILKNAVAAAGLTAALDAPTADLTVFAPTDDAFLSIAAGLGFTGKSEAAAFGYLVDALTLLSGGGDPIPLLSLVLRYHVSDTSLTAAEILALDTIPTLASINIDRVGTTLIDQDPDLADPTLITTDIEADNGIVHAIDGVLLPADLLQSDGSNDVDFVIGNDRRNVINTGRDNDFLSGKGGRDQLIGGKGDDVIVGGDAADKLFGGSGNDSLVGGNGADKLFAGQGNDVINGGAGDDQLRGFKGKDTFVFEEGNDRDVIRDFRIGSDTIDVSSFGITGFDDLDIRVGRNRAVIEIGDDTLVITLRPNAELTADDFLFA